PDWSFRVSKAKVEIGGYAHMKNTRMRVKKLPIFYVPYLIWPAKVDRSSGFLIPTIGYTKNKGVNFGLASYQGLGPLADLTLHLAGYEKRYDGATAELRYAPIEGTKGTMSYQILEDRDLSRRESREIWTQTSDKLPGGFKAVVSVNHYSDYDFF